MAAYPPQSGPPAFEDFLAHLSRQGFVIGVDHYLRLGLLLTKTGREYAPQELKTLLCPIFATSENEQERFYQAFEKFFESSKISGESDTEHTPRMFASHTERTPPSDSKDSIDLRALLSPGLKILIGVMAFGLMTIFILSARTEFIRYAKSIFGSPTPLPTPTTVRQEPSPTIKPTIIAPQPGAPATAAAAGTPTPTPTPVPKPGLSELLSKYSAVIAAVASALIMICIWWLWRRQRKSAGAHKPPFTWRIQAPATDLKEYKAERFYKAARLLRSRQVGEFYRLDIPRTIAATVAAMGYPSFRYRPDSRAPEYLVLIDRASPRDHQARMFDSLAQALEREGIFLLRYFYNGAPHACWNENPGQPVHLVDLQKKYLTHRLLIFGDGRGLTDPISGRLAPWTATLLEWPDRAVLTPKTVASWGFLEKTLADHFVLLPATTQGLSELVNRLESHAGSDFDLSDFDLWKNGGFEPPAPDLDRPVDLAELRDYLGEDTFQWLCACAVYPELNWDLTLYLASLPCMVDGLIGEENLLRLTCLSWFRQGFIPDDIRDLLIEKLDQLQKQEIPLAIIELLKNTKTRGGSYAEHERQVRIDKQQRWLERDDLNKFLQTKRTPGEPEPHEILSDYTLVRYLDSSPRSKYAVLLPLRLQQKFHETGLSAFGLNALVRMSASLILTITSWFRRDGERESEPLATPPPQTPASVLAPATSRQAFLQLLTYAYLLRFPILTAIFLITLPYPALIIGGSALLGSLFDLNAGGIFLVTLAATLSSWSVMITSRLILTYSAERFGIHSLRISPLRWGHILRFGLLIAPILAVIYLQIGGSWRISPARENWLKIIAPAGGILVALSLLWISDFMQRLLNNPATNRKAPNLMPGLNNPATNRDAPNLMPGWLAKRMRNIPLFLGRGYIDYDADPRDRFPLLPGHGGALAMWLTFATVYAALGVITSPWVTSLRAPALAGVLTLLTVLNWGLSGLAFFFDRYRIPVLTLIALTLSLSSTIFSGADSYYIIFPRSANADAKLPPSDLIGPRDGAKVILVAAGGSGIQASAWTARVMAGIEEDCRKGGGCGGRSFAKSVRVISAVSGGGVGVMYFANAYGKYGAKEGELPDDGALGRIVELAERSSLDGVAWGLIYPDFLRAVAPFLSEAPFFWKMDRGRALELEWQRDVNLKARLGEWRSDTAAGKRPGVIFNATMVDNGRPLLFSTVERNQNFSVAMIFDRLYAGYDIPVVTAARLSAAQPFITPAARAHRDDKSDLSQAEYHVVDGGYYDNCGMTTLIEYLDNELENPKVDIKEVMVVSIRSLPTSENAPASTNHGWFYQASMPILASSGVDHISRGDLKLNLLQKRWAERRAVSIEHVIFQIPPLDSSFTWHLTEKQKEYIEEAWQANLNNQNDSLARLKRFLAN
jgi:hypothetical protein